MTLNIDGLRQTLVFVQEGSPVTIAQNTTWESPEFSVEHPNGRGAYSLDLTLDGGGSGLAVIEIRGGNYRRTSTGTPLPSLPALEGFDASTLPDVTASAIATPKELIINVENHNMTFAQIALVVTGDDVVISNAVLRYG